MLSQDMSVETMERFKQHLIDLWSDGHKGLVINHVTQTFGVDLVSDYLVDNDCLPQGTLSDNLVDELSDQIHGHESTDSIQRLRKLLRAVHQSDAPIFHFDDVRISAEPMTMPEIINMINTLYAIQ